MRAREHDHFRLTAADERAGITGVQNQQLFALHAAEYAAQLRGGERILALPVAKEQIDLLVVGGGEHAVRTQVEDGKIVLVALGKGVLRGEDFLCA